MDARTVVRGGRTKRFQESGRRAEVPLSGHHMSNGRASFEVLRHRKGLYIEVTGLYTLDTGRQLRDLFKLAHDVSPVERVLVDVRAAVILLSGSELETYQRESAEDDAVRNPCAVLMLSEQAQMVLPHCARMVELGRVRMPFLEVREALAWVRFPVDALAGRYAR